jgi:hypothetical protein
MNQIPVSEYLSLLLSTFGGGLLVVSAAFVDALEERLNPRRAVRWVYRQLLVGGLLWAGVLLVLGGWGHFVLAIWRTLR